MSVCSSRVQAVKFNTNILPSSSNKNIFINANNTYWNLSTEIKEFQSMSNETFLKKLEEPIVTEVKKVVYVSTKKQKETLELYLNRRGIYYAKNNNNNTL